MILKTGEIMLVIKLLIVLMVCFGFSTLVSAEGGQSRRIKAGLKSGELTPEEVSEIRKDQRATRALKNEMKADGDYTRAERAKIRDLRRGISKKIHSEKHDQEKTPDKVEHDAGNPDPEFDNVD